MGEPAKTQYVNIEDPASGRFSDDLLLGLHGVLIRDDETIVIPGVIALLHSLFRLFENPIVKHAALTGTGSAEAKSVAHNALHFLRDLDV
jgi:hypothetical protein